MELEVEAITENKKGGGIAVYVLHGDLERTNRKTQRIRIGLVTQDFKPQQRGFE